MVILEATALHDIACLRQSALVAHGEIEILSVLRLAESEAAVVLPRPAQELALELWRSRAVVPGVLAALGANVSGDAAMHGRDLALAEAVLSWLADVHHVHLPFNPERLAVALVAAVERGER